MLEHNEKLSGLQVLESPLCPLPLSRFHALPLCCSVAQRRPTVNLCCDSQFFPCSEIGIALLQGSTDYSPGQSGLAAYSWSFIGPRSHLFISKLLMAAFTLEKQSWTVETETIWPTKPELSPLQKKIANPWPSINTWNNLGFFPIISSVCSFLSSLQSFISLYNIKFILSNKEFRPWLVWLSWLGIILET